jgi:hypothetical protein
MDTQLPAQLVQLLAPYLPYLLKGLKLASQEAAKALGEKAGEQGFEQAKTLWEKLRPKMEARRRRCPGRPAPATEETARRRPGPGAGTRPPALADPPRRADRHRQRQSLCGYRRQCER